MTTFFSIGAAMIHLDGAAAVIGHEDVFSEIATCRRHRAATALDEGYVDAFVR